ncbi:MAG: hypothetical protein U5K76_07400 [Woeseiaceae bacterium]|nr:hypothetical protein [Woeseiaceae bacterium]
MLLVANVAMNLVLIPMYGIEGAGFGKRLQSTDLEYFIVAVARFYRHQ